MSRAPKRKKATKKPTAAGKGVSLRFSPDEHAELSREADANCRTVRQQIQWRLRQGQGPTE